MKKVRLHWPLQLSESTITEPVILRILSFCSRSRDYYIIRTIIIKDYNIIKIQFVQCDESRLGDATYKRCTSFHDNINYWGTLLVLYVINIYKCCTFNNTPTFLTYLRYHVSILKDPLASSNIYKNIPLISLYYKK